MYRYNDGSNTSNIEWFKDKLLVPFKYLVQCYTQEFVSKIVFDHLSDFIPVCGMI